MKEANVGGESTAPTIPGYALQAEIGEGRMGVVYRATKRGGDEVVAVKVIKPTFLPSTEAASAFVSEMNALLLAAGPNIVQVLEVSDFGKRPLWFAMEYVGGGTLKEKLESIPFKPSPRDSAELLLVLAGAVEHLHAKGIFHGDLNPANVLLAADRDEGHLRAWGYYPLIGDSGVAARIDDDGKVERPQTVVVRAGTPGCKAPEQFCETNGLGPPADVFALGCILYWCLTGMPPVRVTNSTHVHSRRAAKKLADVPRDLQSICLKCLENDPEDRYVNAGKLAEELKKFLTGRSVKARRNRGYVLLGMTILLCLLLGVGGVLAATALKAKADQRAALERMPAKHVEATGVVPVPVGPANAVEIMKGTVRVPPGRDRNLLILFRGGGVRPNPDAGGGQSGITLELFAGDMKVRKAFAYHDFDHPPQISPSQSHDCVLAFTWKKVPPGEYEVKVMGYCNNNPCEISGAGRNRSLTIVEVP